VTISALGSVARYPADDNGLKPTGRGSRCVKAMGLRAGDELAELLVVRPGDEELLVITREGCGPRGDAPRRARNAGAAPRSMARFPQEAAPRALPRPPAGTASA